MEEAAKDQHQIRRVGRPRKVASAAEFVAPLNGESRTLEPDIAKAQEYANRVWAGQSISEYPDWRLGRVREALEGQGLPTDGVIVGGHRL